MNFPESQKTGALAELAVQTLFTSWLWTTSRDHIDTGYDFSVEPDRKRFHGRRFLVQVKGTSRAKKGSPTAAVKKSNLRQYADNRLPVFLIRCAADGTLHWLHVQPWASQNIERLRGDGSISVPLPGDQRLVDKEEFSAYLDEIFRPAAERPNGAAAAARQRSEYLSSLDPRLTIDVAVIAGREHYTIRPSSPDARVSICASVVVDDSESAQLASAIHYGLPTEIQARSVTLTGSDALAAIGADRLGPRTLSISPAESHPAEIALYAGKQYSILARELHFLGRIYSGEKGYSFVSSEQGRIITARMTGNLSPPTVQLSMSLFGDRISKAPLRQHTELRELSEWAGSVLEEGELLLELRIRGSRIGRGSCDKAATRQVSGLLKYFFWIGRLHSIAKALDSDFHLPHEVHISPDELQEIDLFYRALRGERIPVSVNSCHFLVGENRPLVYDAIYRVETEISLAISGSSVGSIPIAVEMHNFTRSQVEGHNKWALTPDKNATAFLSYNEDRQAREPTD